MTPDQLRQRYLDFMSDEVRRHAIIPSAPLVPENDPTTLFTGSGMQPMLPYLLGESHPKGQRIADSQKCFRSQDIEEVGDNRHSTFFEMLGNWSLGDYFKAEQIAWMFEFLTDPQRGCGLDPSRLFVTVFKGAPELDIPRDEEAVAIWQKVFESVGLSAKTIDTPETGGLQDGRIFYYEADKNWWSRVGVPANMPVGEPGGPDSEMFFDFGAERQLHEQSAFANQPCHVNCDCGRFMEIGNNVFMTYRRAESGFEPLQQKNIDFGGGLERLLAAIHDDPDIFLTSAYQPIISRLEERIGVQYGADPASTKSLRVMADHSKAAVFLAGDGVTPSNKGQGYYARRLVRRMVRFAHQLGLTELFVADLVPLVTELYKEGYPDLTARQAEIQTILGDEERKFRTTLSKGLRELEKVPKLDGALAFKLYETYGFPWELTVEIAEERGEKIDKAAFDAEFSRHRDQSRTASAGMFKGGLEEHSAITTKYHTATHLLHAALRQILGNHVQQKGSNITAERLRFDFTHPQAVAEAELQQIEQQINAWIADDLLMTRQTMSKSAALAAGALAFFVEKYPDQVSVYTIGHDPDQDWISKELCGGPHVTRTGEIGPIKIVKEQAVAAGVRRVYIQLA